MCFFTKFSGGGFVGVGGRAGMGMTGWAKRIGVRPPRKFKKACGRPCESYPETPNIDQILTKRLVVAR